MVNTWRWKWRLMIVVFLARKYRWLYNLSFAHSPSFPSLLFSCPATNQQICKINFEGFFMKRGSMSCNVWIADKWQPTNWCGLYSYGYRTSLKAASCHPPSKCLCTKKKAGLVGPVPAYCMPAYKDSSVADFSSPLLCVCLSANLLQNWPPQICLKLRLYISTTVQGRRVVKRRALLIFSSSPFCIIFITWWTMHS